MDRFFIKCATSFYNRRKENIKENIKEKEKEKV